MLSDRVRLEQALSNLVENALRSGQGTIDVHTRLLEDQLELHVTDEGEGFPPEFLPRACERFSRADRSRRRGGVGLGPSIVEAIARVPNNGHAHAANRSHGGADVWITGRRAAGVLRLNLTRVSDSRGAVAHASNTPPASALARCRWSPSALASVRR